MQKRHVDLVVLSDIHLGTYGCHAAELSRYLESIDPAHLVLNGDIIDIWQFNPRYWPKAHMRVLQQILGYVEAGIPVTYITGNHDEILRRFVNFRAGSLRILNKIVLELGERKAWIFHGDVFDVTMQHSKWLAKLGSTGYDLLILLNRFANFLLMRLGLPRISLSKKIKDSVKSAVRFINDFEHTAADIGITNGYDFVVCGHIHQPVIRAIVRENGGILYLNSGDWVENLSSLEYNRGEWSLYRYADDPQMATPGKDPAPELAQSELFKNLIAEFRLG